jgi:hypothetical protein
MEALCAGGCGQMLPGNAKSLPPGQRMCRACRREASAGRKPMTSRGSKPSKRIACALCGGWMHKGKTSLPEGQATCRECRRKTPAPYGPRDGSSSADHGPRPCPICGTVFTPFVAVRRGYVQKACSRACGQLLRFPGGGTAYEREQERWRQKNRQRRGDDIISEPYVLAEIAKRDRFRCGLCHRKVNMRLSGLHPQGPTIDHIIPLVISRDDTRANVQLAHRRCNVAKHTRAVGEQLLLFG